ncbi:hypothetical protein WJX74_002765 [Apatococcus lobatus]|uniref:Uncharacterized protein n=1 Tax=Apatococcus lobatus TaxID=904363 RepID=A0AAW1RA54_9CHLO
MHHLRGKECWTSALGASEEPSVTCASKPGRLSLGGLPEGRSYGPDLHLLRDRHGNFELRPVKSVFASCLVGVVHTSS